MRNETQNSATRTAGDEGGTVVSLPRLLDWRDACAALGGISRATLDRLTKSKALKVRRPAPGIVRWAEGDIIEYLDSVTFPRSKAS